MKGIVKNGDIDLRKDLVIFKGLRCKNCGKKYLGDYNIKNFGLCNKCNTCCWELIKYKGNGYTSEIIVRNI